MSSRDHVSPQQFFIETEHGSFYLSQHDDGAVKAHRFGIGTNPRGEGHGSELAGTYLTAAREHFPDATTARVYSAQGGTESFWGKQGFNVVKRDGPGERMEGVEMERTL